MRTLPLLILVLLASAAPLAAQRVPERPALTPQADTNSAAAYMDLARESLQDRPRVAAAAFYWASQIDPTSADALYGRHAAELASDPRDVMAYWEASRRQMMRNARLRQVDSLYFRALTMNPFLYRRYETHLFRMYLTGAAREDLERSGQRIGNPEIQHWISNLLLTGSMTLRAQNAYANGNFQEALRLYEQALRDGRRRSWLRAERARLLAQIGSDSAAIADFQMAIGELRREDERDLVYVYESKALMEYGIGKLHERGGNTEAAREAYGRALTEDLAFYPAHVSMGLLALGAGDTATALAELDLAVQAAGNDAGTGFYYGAALAQTGRLDEAAAQLARVIEAWPHYADPRFILAAVHDQQGSIDAAVEAYRAFLEHAGRDHPRRAAAEQRLADLDPPLDAAGGQ